MKKNESNKNKLTDLQVQNRLKEIAKFDMPLEINKRLRKLKNGCDYTLQVLGKQLNHIRKAIKKESVTHVTNDTHVTHVTHVTNDDIKACVTFVTRNTLYLGVVFGDSVLEQIMRYLCLEKKPLSFGELALKLGKSESHIKNTISRNKQFFGIIKPNGKMCYTYLLRMVFFELQTRIDDLKKLEAQKKKAEDELKLKELKEKDFVMEVKNYIYSCKPKRVGMFIIINFGEIVVYSPELADLLLENPERFIKQLKNHYPSTMSIKIINVPCTSQNNIEDIRKDHLNKMISVEGRVTSLGEVKPVITKITFECPACGTLINVKQNYRIGKLAYPSRCSCGRRSGFITKGREESNACFVQLEDLQDKTDNPHSRRIKGILFDSLCEPEEIRKFTPGNEVKCVGILKEVPIFKGLSESVFLNWVFEIQDVELIEKEIEIEKFDDDIVEEINILSNEVDKNGISALYDSFAPEVYGYGEMKGAMILQLCNRRNDPKNKSVRNKSNILMIGDPGIAKSVLGDFALKVSSGGRKAVGGGSSAVGITASVIKEEDSLGGYRVEPGAMILAKDLLFIDELNNLQDEDKPKLQEGMNEQRVSINKANLHVQMKVTCGIIAAANPIHGNFKDDSKLSLQEQFNIPTPILNRFDSIFVMRDDINEDGDKKIAERMIKRQRGQLKPKHSIDFLKKFFAYIKNLEEPEIDDEAQAILSKAYSSARKIYHCGVKINPRFLESLTRMSIAASKLRQSNKVELKDVQTSIEILSKTQYQVDELILTNQK